ncbi:Uncharacterised protein [Bacteroides ovatus]|uniref:Uncharacterized protein n=1 Tax=Bacteroides ovatus TaxID=28116 RepID=A0A6N2SZY8_BACOV
MKKGRQDRIAETLTSGETDESGIKLQIEEGFTRKDLGSNGL